MKINVKVIPQSGKCEVIKKSNEDYKVYLKKSPKDNKANIELLKVLKKYFCKDIKIIKGLKSKNKVVKISD